MREKNVKKLILKKIAFYFLIFYGFGCLYFSYFALPRTSINGVKVGCTRLDDAIEIAYIETDAGFNKDGLSLKQRPYFFIFSLFSRKNYTL